MTRMPSGGPKTSPRTHAKTATKGWELNFSTLRPLEIVQDKGFGSRTSGSPSPRTHSGRGSGADGFVLPFAMPLAFRKEAWSNKTKIHTPSWKAVGSSETIPDLNMGDSSSEEDISDLSFHKRHDRCLEGLIIAHRAAVKAAKEKARADKKLTYKPHKHKQPCRNLPSKPKPVHSKAVGDSSQQAHPNALKQLLRFSIIPSTALPNILSFLHETNHLASSSTSSSNVSSLSSNSVTLTTTEPARKETVTCISEVSSNSSSSSATSSSTSISEAIPAKQEPVGMQDDMKANEQGDEDVDDEEEDEDGQESLDDSVSIASSPAITGLSSTSTPVGPSPIASSDSGSVSTASSGFLLPMAAPTIPVSSSMAFESSSNTQEANSVVTATPVVRTVTPGVSSSSSSSNPAASATPAHTVKKACPLFEDMFNYDVRASFKPDGSWIRPKAWIRPIYDLRFEPVPPSSHPDVAPARNSLKRKPRGALPTTAPKRLLQRAGTVDASTYPPKPGRGRPGKVPGRVGRPPGSGKGKGKKSGSHGQDVLTAFEDASRLDVIGRHPTGQHPNTSHGRSTRERKPSLKRKQGQELALAQLERTRLKRTLTDPGAGRGGKPRGRGSGRPKANRNKADHPSRRRKARARSEETAEDTWELESELLALSKPSPADYLESVQARRRAALLKLRFLHLAQRVATLTPPAPQSPHQEPVSSPSILQPPVSAVAGSKSSSSCSSSTSSSGIVRTITTSMPPPSPPLPPTLLNPAPKKRRIRIFRSSRVPVVTEQTLSTEDSLSQLCVSSPADIVSLRPEPQADTISGPETYTGNVSVSVPIKPTGSEDQDEARIPQWPRYSNPVLVEDVPCSAPLHAAELAADTLDTLDDMFASFSPKSPSGVSTQSGSDCSCASFGLGTLSHTVGSPCVEALASSTEHIDDILALVLSERTPDLRPSSNETSLKGMTLGPGPSSKMAPVSRSAGVSALVRAYLFPGVPRVPSIVDEGFATD